MGQGAEARVYRTEYMGRDAILKVRPEKGYRHPDLDRSIRTSRTKNEARVAREARRAGVRTPVIYDIDVKGSGITMERVDGRTVKNILDRDPARAPEICSVIGRTVARLHSGRISHGDLTTSNMILTEDGGLCLIDLSMGSVDADTEEMGVDLHLLKRAFASAHSDLHGSFDRILGSYAENNPDAEAVFGKMEEIANRGRYT